MIHLKKFNEMKFQDRFDYDRIILILKKTKGWGFGIISSIDEFENNQEYFLNPQNEDEYAEQFHIFLTDKINGSLRGKFINNPSINFGNFRGQPHLNKPSNWYGKST